MKKYLGGLKPINKIKYKMKDKKVSGGFETNREKENISGAIEIN